MTTVLAIDPGPTESAWLTFVNGCPEALFRSGRPFGKGPNADVLSFVQYVEGAGEGMVVIEKVASYGMPVGEEVFETVFWSGRFAQAAGGNVERITRKAIVTHLCGSARAKDSNVRRELLDRFGGDAAGRKGGALYGIHGDVWQALAVAVAWSEGAR